MPTASVIPPYTDAAARAAHCWFNVDHVARDPATTAWKRRARWAQAQWRIVRGFPIGAQPYAGGPGATLVGSRLELAFARSSAANFITPEAAAAVTNRLALPEPHQTLLRARLWADLLSSMPMCFNLFGDLAADRAAARNAVTAWWPDAPAGQVRLRFEHSPGRRDPSFLGNRSAFDAAFDIDAGSGHAGIIGVETKYHEHPQCARLPKPAALARYIEVTERSGLFVDGWREKLLGTSLQQIWLDHLLVLAMLQHPSHKWIWGRFVLVFPSANPSYASVAASYAALLRDSATFQARTLEALLDASVVPAREFRARYLW